VPFLYNRPILLEGLIRRFGNAIQTSDDICDWCGGARCVAHDLKDAGVADLSSFRHTTGVPKDGLAPFGILHFR
jgi:hypothetical protein